MAFSNRDLKKEKYWQEIVEQFKQSKMSGAQFCRQHELSEHKLHYWKNIIANRLKKKNQQQKLTENKIEIPFVPLSLPNNIELASQQNPSSDQIEISKIVLRISAGADKSTLTCILQSLEKA
jgi:transposase-like protein